MPHAAPSIGYSAASALARERHSLIWRTPPVLGLSSLVGRVRGSHASDLDYRRVVSRRRRFCAGIERSNNLLLSASTSQQLGITRSMWTRMSKPAVRLAGV